MFNMHVTNCKKFHNLLATLTFCGEKFSSLFENTVFLNLKYPFSIALLMGFLLVLFVEVKGIQRKVLTCFDCQACASET